MMPMTRFSRREAIFGLPILAAAPFALPTPAVAIPSTEERLRRALAAIELPTSFVQLDLISFGRQSEAGRTRMHAVVRMTWLPGFRQRGFRIEARDEDTALALLVEDIRNRFLSAF